MSIRKPYKMKIVEGNFGAVHIQIVEAVLGFKLPKSVVVHHIDENTLNNSPDNLVVCQDRAYHNLLHKRMRALAACGNANWSKCPYCKEYDDPKNLVDQVRYSKRKNNNPSLVHAECKKVYMHNYFKTYRKVT